MNFVESGRLESESNTSLETNWTVSSITVSDWLSDSTLTVMI